MPDHHHPKNTITITPINGIPRDIKVITIRSVKTAGDVFKYDQTDKDKLKTVITLDADITGDLSDENIIVDESIQEVKSMLNRDCLG